MVICIHQLQPTTHGTYRDLRYKRSSQPQDKESGYESVLPHLRVQFVVTHELHGWLQLVMLV